jgi:Ca2+-binding EF-hand superfamily protein
MASLDASIDLRPRTIFDHFDVNKDGKLNFEELNALQVKTSGVAMTRPQWAQVCETFQIKPDSAGLTFDHILMTCMYQTI